MDEYLEAVEQDLSRDSISLGVAMDSNMQSIGSPAAPIQSIGKLSDDWCKELSPISKKRESLTDSSSVGGRLSEEYEKDLQTESDKTAAIQDLDKANNRNVGNGTQLGQTRGAEWYMGSDSTPSLSTSSEFSLESFIEVNQSNRKSNKCPNIPVIDEPQYMEKVAESSTDIAKNGSQEKDDQGNCATASTESKVNGKSSEETQENGAYDNNKSSKPLSVDPPCSTPNDTSTRFQAPVNDAEKRLADTLSLQMTKPTTPNSLRPDEKKKHDITEGGPSNSGEMDALNSSSSVDGLIVSPKDQKKRASTETFLDSTESPVRVAEKQQLTVRQDTKPPASLSTNPTRRVTSFLSQTPSSPPALVNKSCNDYEWFSPSRRALLGEAVGDLSLDAGLSKASRDQDFAKTQQQLGATSFEFNQLLRGAAQRRKQKLARCRDSLVAKELEHREAIAASQHLLQQAPPSLLFHHVKKDNPLNKEAASTKFKAKPVPSTTGPAGSGGLTGVPKVLTKPTTTPSSPLLGARRANPPKVGALKEPTSKPRMSHKAEQMMKKPKQSAPGLNNDDNTFKARSIPASAGMGGRCGQSGVPKVPTRPVTVPSSPLLGHRRRHSTKEKIRPAACNGGQSGVPKVTKRPVTVPKSPCLGPRRRHSIVAGKENATEKPNRRVSTGMMHHSAKFQQTTKASPVSLSSCSKASSASLVGLNFLSPQMTHVRRSPPKSTPRNSQKKAFEPSSTKRAKSRAEFDAKRLEIARRRQEEEIENREKIVRKLHGDLEVLREEI